MSAEQRIVELGLEFPPVRPAAGNYVASVRTGSLLFMSGMGPSRLDGSSVTGKVGGDVTIEQAVEAARLVGLQQLAAIRRELGSLDRVRRVVKVLGMVNCAPGFNRTPEVINGFSDLFVDVFGEAGRGARSAVGMAELPFDIAVEIEVILEVDD